MFCISDVLVGLYSPLISVSLLAGPDDNVHMIMGADQVSLTPCNLWAMLTIEEIKIIVT